jgi:hypothetical protein
MRLGGKKVQKIESELLSRGYKRNRETNWVNGDKIVQVVAREFRNGKIWVCWDEAWKDYYCLIFDYSKAGGPTCVVPANGFFNFPFVFNKRQTSAYANSRYTWRQPFDLSHELSQFILGYKDRWDMLGKSLTSQKQVPMQQPEPKLLKQPQSAAISFMGEKQFTEFLQKKLDLVTPSERKIILEVWSNKDDYIKWAKEGILLIPGLVRPKDKAPPYSPELIRKFKEKGILVDTRTNGPAIMSYLLAGGERPNRRDINHGWTIHHIYDGKFALENGRSSVRAVTHGDHFTQSAGVVAIHPIADALADEYFYFAWMLRLESFKRFGYDPDNVFSR